MNIDKLEELSEERDKAQDRIDDINYEISQIVDQCPGCGNWHYPHC